MNVNAISGYYSFIKSQDGHIVIYKNRITIWGKYKKYLSYKKNFEMAFAENNIKKHFHIEIDINSKRFQQHYFSIRKNRKKIKHNNNP